MEALTVCGFAAQASLCLSHTHALCLAFRNLLRPSTGRVLQNYKTTPTLQSPKPIEFLYFSIFTKNTPLQPISF